MVDRDPALIICLGAARDGWSITTDNADLLSRLDLLGTSAGALGALATLATTALLGEESGDPGAVDEVAGTGKGT